MSAEKPLYTYHIEYRIGPGPNADVSKFSVKADTLRQGPEFSTGKPHWQLLRGEVIVAEVLGTITAWWVE